MVEVEESPFVAAESIAVFYQQFKLREEFDKLAVVQKMTVTYELYKMFSESDGSFKTPVMHADDSIDA